ncbi:hypothetical protein COO60DRAFT_1641647 [Scenedesmus sp. NREL 46B-D3]|nr:hypothetical protein COO60DRAFT_1641647 [Scenedesmus sp. NREL 46B-D3]
MTVDKDLQDLVEFLGSKRPEVQQAAVDIVSGLSGSPEGINRLKGIQVALLGALLRITGTPDADPAVSRAALTALVNLSQDAALGKALLQFNTVALQLMLLVNLTVDEQGCEHLLQLSRQGMEGLHMALLLQMFVKSAVTLMPGQPDPYEHIGALLTNSTRLQAGRKLLLQPGRGFLQALAAQLGPGSSLARRRGCSGALRNCCISAEEDGTLQELVSDKAVLARVLAPLGGDSSTGTDAAAAPAATSSGSAGAGAAAGAASASSAGRDPDDSVREALAEAIAVLAATDAGRKELWKVSAPELLRKAYEDEEHPGVCQAMEHAARCFMFDANAAQVEGHEGNGQEQLQMQQEAAD